MASVCRLLARLRRNDRGNVLAIVGAALVPLTIMIGSGIDLSRAYMAKAKLQNACDAGVLAGRRSVTSNGFDNAAKDVAEDYFDVNFANVADVSSTSFVPTTSDNGNTIVGTATTNLQMTN